MTRRNLVFLIFLLFPFYLQAQNTAVVVVNHEGIAENPDVRRTIEHTVSAMEEAFSNEGFDIVKRIQDNSAGGIPLEVAHTAAVEAEARWALTVYTHLEGSRLSWHFSVYDAEDHIVRGTDTFFTFVYIGISAVSVIEQSAKSVAELWRNSFTSQGFDGNFAVEYRQGFTSFQRGVNIFFGDENGLFLGTVEGQWRRRDGGFLPTLFHQAPYLSFIEGDSVFGVLTKEGYWSKNFTLKNGITGRNFHLPFLQKITRHAFSAGFEMNGSKEMAINIEYRRHFLPDRFFLALDGNFWLDFSSDRPLRAQELRLSPAFYLLPWRDSSVRVLAGLSLSSLFPDSDLPKLLAYPLWLGLEYHLPRIAIKASVRIPLLLNELIDDDLVEVLYYTPPQDSWKLSFFGISLNFGVMFKW